MKIRYVEGPNLKNITKSIGIIEKAKKGIINMFLNLKNGRGEIDPTFCVRNSMNPSRGCLSWSTANRIKNNPIFSLTSFKIYELNLNI